MARMATALFIRCGSGKSSPVFCFQILETPGETESTLPRNVSSEVKLGSTIAIVFRFVGWLVGFFLDATASWKRAVSFSWVRVCVCVCGTE